MGGYFWVPHLVIQIQHSVALAIAFSRKVTTMGAETVIIQERTSLSFLKLLLKMRPNIVFNYQGRIYPTTIKSLILVTFRSVVCMIAYRLNIYFWSATNTYHLIVEKSLAEAEFFDLIFLEQRLCLLQFFLMKGCLRVPSFLEWLP